jgi:hypothetical protein
MACGDSNPGYRSTPRGTPGPYTNRPGGSGKWPMVRAFAVLFVAMSGMPGYGAPRSVRGAAMDKGCM